MSTNVGTFIADLDAGTVQDKLGTMLSLVAASPGHHTHYS